MFNASEIGSIIRCNRQSVVDPGAIIEFVSIDSRQVVHGRETLFIAIQGERTDGHKYLDDAWSKGVRNFIISSDADTSGLADSNIYHVDDSIKALQDLAGHHRSKFDIPVIGITGSNGKTWVKEWLAQMLLPDLKVVKSPRSYNSQIGVALSLLRFREHHEIAIVEVGISRSGEMGRLSGIVRPDIGILTNIGDAHDAGFVDRIEKLQEKCGLFDGAKAVIFSADDELVSGGVKDYCSESQLIGWGSKPECALQVEASESDDILNYNFDGQSCTLEVPSTDEASRKNLLTCCTVLHYLGLKSDEVERRAAILPPVNMRLEMHSLPGNCLLIDDTYSLDLASLEVGLETLNQHGLGRSRAVILSDVDAQHAFDYRDIGHRLSAHGVDMVYGIGAQISLMDAVLPDSIRTQYFKTVDEFIEARPWQGLLNTVYLLKGARKYGLEKVVEQMRLKSHSAVLEIDFNAMISNLRVFANKLGPHTQMIAMVKAAAYGSGTVEVGKFLEHNNVDRLCVAYVDEGVELRRAGVTIPIMVLNPDPSELAYALEFRLEPEVYNFAILEAALRAADISGQQLGVHIKLDSGMHRLGFMPAHVDRLAKMLKGQALLNVESVFTHLAAADDPAQDAFTRQQVSRFESMYEELASALGQRPDRHVLNSHGVLRFPEYQFEAVRLGIGLYGLGSYDGDALEPVHTFRARISQLRTIRAGETVGYGRSFSAERETVVATINAGYADGIPRLAGSCGYSVWINGHESPIIGRICMDMCMLDVTDMPEVMVGDDVEIFGPHMSVDRLAECCQTISYEILTGISQRVPRIFKFD